MTDYYKTSEEITKIFLAEFNHLKDKFTIIDLPVADAKESKTPFIWHPGVYIFLHPQKGVIKIGRHLTNYRKRALEHLTDNTKNEKYEMTSLKDDTSARLLLFNLINPEDKHWAAAVEIYLENKLNLLIPSKISG